LLPFYGLEAGKAGAAGIAPVVVGAITARAQTALHPRIAPKIENGGSEMQAFP
jgi:hypothetical protein